MRRSVICAFTIAAFVPLAGCGLTSTQKGALIGAGAGGVVGAGVGSATGSTVRGAIIGAVVGGAAGAIIGSQMDKQADELAYELPGATVQRIGEGIVVTFPEGLLFTFDSYEVTPAARENLRKLAASLHKYPNTRTLIVGHTDSQGSDAYNQTLSEQRAVAAANFIVGEGIDHVRVSTAGRGESEPIADNATDEGRRLNRRIEIAIYAPPAD